MKKGIDVSGYQGTIDWAKVKAAGIDFAILKLGNIYDTDVNSIDSKFERNYQECLKNNILVGVYVYNYCNSIEALRKGTKWVIDKLNKRSLNLPVYLDMEDKTIAVEGKTALTNQCIEFAKIIQAESYEAGVYANLNWWKNYLDADKLDKDVSIWVAQYYKECEYKKRYDIWQYSSSGKVNGINSERIDMNYLYNESIIKANTNTKTIEKLAQEVIQGKWSNGEARKLKLTKAGYDYTKVQNKVNELLNVKTLNKKSNEEIAKEIIQGKWSNGTERKKKLESAGYNYNDIQKIVNQKLK